jgi:hypothetical protein
MKKVTGHEKRMTSARSIKKCARADSMSDAAARSFDYDDESCSEVVQEH